MPRSFRSSVQHRALVGPLAMCAVLLRGYLLHHEPAYRRRLRWVVMGVVAGLVPVMMMDVATSLGFNVGDFEVFPERAVITPLAPV